MALEKGRLPRSLFLDKPNDAIDFAGLNLAPNAKERPLDRAKDGEYAAICNYGFGGTNAHVLIKAVPQAAKAESALAEAPVLLLSAATKDALTTLAAQVADKVEQGVPAQRIARDFGHFREIQKLRLAVSTKDSAAIAGLRAYAEGRIPARISWLPRFSLRAPAGFCFLRKWLAIQRDGSRGLSRERRIPQRNRRDRRDPSSRFRAGPSQPAGSHHSCG